MMRLVIKVKFLSEVGYVLAKTTVQTEKLNRECSKNSDINIYDDIVC